jgi:hypothetical protein
MSTGEPPRLCAPPFDSALPLLPLLVSACVCFCVLQTAKPFSFCTHSWIYDPASKSRILQLENQMQQLEAFEQSMLGVSSHG